MNIKESLIRAKVSSKTKYSYIQPVYTRQKFDLASSKMSSTTRFSFIHHVLYPNFTVLTIFLLYFQNAQSIQIVQMEDKITIAFLMYVLVSLGMILLVMRVKVYIIQ